MPATVEMVNATKDNFDEDDLVKFQELFVVRIEALYKGCPDFKLSAIVYTQLEGITNGVLHYPADSQAWRTIDEKFPEIAEDPRNLRLGISADGVDVNTGNRHHNETNKHKDQKTASRYERQRWEDSKAEKKQQKKRVVQAKKNVAESLVRTLLHVSRKTKDGVNARLDQAELGVNDRVIDASRLVSDMCILEKFFPSAFYCFMIHLTVTTYTAGDNPGKRIAFLENEHSESFAKWLRKEVERELAISKESVSETVRWISYGPCATVVKYDAYNINGQIPLFKFDWINHRAGGVKCDNLGYTLVDLNNLGHKVDPFILASQARQVFYVKDQIDKKLSVVFKKPPKNYKDTYDEVDEEFSTVIHQRNDNILPCVNRRDLGNESRDDYYRTDCGEPFKAFVLLQILL
ncbi:putative reverse transcriptase domain-containing protein [Tanacetum coccineum]